VSCLGRAAAGRLSQSALHGLQDYLFNYIAHLPIESQATFSGNCRRCGGLSHYWPAVYLGGDITFSNFEQPIRWTLNPSAAAIRAVRGLVQNVPGVPIVQVVRRNEIRRIIGPELV
jgi:hypothetical protein